MSRLKPEGGGSTSLLKMKIWPNAERREGAIYGRSKSSDDFRCADSCGGPDSDRYSGGLLLPLDEAEPPGGSSHGSDTQRSRSHSKCGREPPGRDGAHRGDRSFVAPPRGLTESATKGTKGHRNLVPRAFCAFCG